LTLSLTGCEWSAPRLMPMYPWGEISGTHWIGGWLGPRTGLIFLEKGKISCPCQESSLGSSARHQSLYSLSSVGLR
jgi:hypothetical protein